MSKLSLRPWSSALLQLAALIAWLMVDPVEAQTKRAFVVGIDAYDNFPPHAQLRKAVGDAKAISQALAELGFKATTHMNITRSRFNETWQEFLEAIEPGDSISFVFSGHGVEISGSNYLIPRDVPRIRLGREEQLKRESLSLSELLADLRDRRPGLIFIVLDACRDNPFSEGTRAVGSQSGLARVEPPEGTFIMFSAGAYQTALDRLSDDDKAETSVYTRTLIPRLQQPGLSILEMADLVGEEVRALAATADHRQMPAFYSGVVGSRKVCLAGCSPNSTDVGFGRRRQETAATAIDLDKALGKEKADHLRQQHATLTKRDPAKRPKAIPECNSALLPIDATLLGPKFSCLLVDFKTGGTLMATRPDAVREPSSLAKLMTLYIAFKKIKKGALHLDDVVVVSDHASQAPPAKLALSPGSRLTVRDAISAIVTKSANDIAIALGESIAGSEAAFVAEMNATAGRLAMHGTRFSNTSGLPDPTQVTTAIDLVSLATAILRETPEYYHYFSLRDFEFAGQIFKNNNTLLNEGGVDGFKTGYTMRSGFNMVFSAERDDTRIIGIILGMATSTERNSMVRLIFDESFAIAKKGGPLTDYTKILQ